MRNIVWAALSLGAGLTCLGGPAAAAEDACPARTEQVGKAIDAGQSAITARGRIDALLAECANSPQALNLAARYELTTLRAAPSQREALDRAYDLIDRARIARGHSDHDLLYTRSETIKAMLALEKATGKPAAQMAPRRYDACENHMVSNSLAATAWMQDNGVLPGGRRYVEDIAAACASAPSRLNRAPLAHRARLLTTLAAQDPASPEAPGLTDRARADVLAYFGEDLPTASPTGPHDIIAWSEADQARLYRLRFELMGQGRLAPMPREQWFTSEGLADPEGLLALALAVDEAWAASSMANRYQPYRDVMNAAHADLQAKGAGRPARNRLWIALADHARGTYRRARNKDLPAPPAFLYDWLKPLS